MTNYNQTALIEYGSYSRASSNTLCMVFAQISTVNHQKSDNLQYNMLGCWDERLIEQASDVPNIIIFQNFLQNSLQKLIQFIFLFFHKFTTIKIKSFECPKSIRNFENK